MPFSAFAQDHGEGEKASPAEVERLLHEADGQISTSEAIEKAHAALQIARDIRFESAVRKSLALLGRRHAEAGQPAEALRFYIEAINLTRTASGQKAALAELCATVGDLYFKEKIYRSALDYYREAALLRQNDEASLEKIGDSFAEARQPDSAKTYFNQALFRLQKRDDLVGQIRIYQKLASAYNKFSDSLQMASTALNYLLRLEKLVDRTGNLDQRSILHNNIACQFTRLEDFGQAVEYFKKVELQCGYPNVTCDRSLLYTNLGIALHNSGRSKEGIDYLLRAVGECISNGLDADLPHLEHLIARTYFSQNDVYNALSHNEKAIRFARARGQNDILAAAYRTEAELYYLLYDFEKALEFFRKYLDLEDQLRLAQLSRQQRLEQQQFFLQSSEKEIQLLLERQKVQDLAFGQLNFEKEKLELANQNLAREAALQEKNLIAERQKSDAQTAQAQAELRTKELEALRVSADLRAAAQRFEAEKKDRQIVDLQQKEALSAAELAKIEADEARKIQEIEFLKLRSATDERFRTFAYWLGLALSAIAVLLLLGLFLSRKTARKLALQKAEIDRERHESERLLGAILPAEVAAELKATGAATPRFYEKVTILFTDFTNFTQLAEKMQPAELVEELNTCFSAFDQIAERHGLERIKTIGDSYMAAGGVPVVNTTNALDAVAAAREMFEFLKKRHLERPDRKGWQMRIGIHTGQVVAGVIGQNKFAYDIWGDAVNTAARMEQHGEPGRINISGATHEVVKAHFRCSFRGTIEAKNKGQVDMFFVD